MAIYHCSVKLVKRSAGRSVTAAAAYRSGSRIVDERTGQVNDYTRKRGVDFTSINAPDNAPGWVQDRARLWNAVEHVEARKDAQLAREVEIALPRELSPAQQRELVDGFTRSQFVSAGMVADVAIHDQASENPHAHILLTMRDLALDGFGKKNRSWNDRQKVDGWRKEWEKQANEALERAGYSERIDRRTLEAQGIDRLPTVKLGPVAAEMERKGKASERGDMNREREGLREAHAATSAEIIQLQDKRDDLECRVQPEAVIARYDQAWTVERQQIATKSEELRDKTHIQIRNLDIFISSHQQMQPEKGFFTSQKTHTANLSQWADKKRGMDNRRWQLKERADKLGKGIEILEGKYEGYNYQSAGDQLAHNRMEKKQPKLSAMYRKAREAKWEKDRRALDAKRKQASISREFSDLAAKRAGSVGGFRDADTAWQATPEPLRKLIDGYNQTPKDMKSGILEILTSDPKKAPQIAALLEQRREILRQRGRRQDYGR